MKPDRIVNKAHFLAANLASLAEEIAKIATTMKQAHIEKQGDPRTPASRRLSKMYHHDIPKN